MGKSKIEWCDKTWGVVTGCTPVSAGCQNCWAAAMAKRFPKLHTTSGGCSPGGGELLLPKFSDVLLHPECLEDPAHWKKPRVVFIAPMGDLFHEMVGDLFLRDVFREVILSSGHTFVVPTKRPERMREFWRGEHGKNLRIENGLLWHHEQREEHILNLYLGVSVEDQPTCDERVGILLDMPATHRFVSVEPMLDQVDFACCSKPTENYWANGIDWVIAGCESGPGRRPAPHDWFRSLRDQCVDGGAPFFLKQMAVNEDGTGKVEKMPRLDGEVYAQTPWGGEADGVRAAE